MPGHPKNDERRRRQDYIQARLRGRTQTESRKIAGLSKTTAWRIDKARGLTSPKPPPPVDGPAFAERAGVRPGRTDLREKLERVLEADDVDELADAFAESEPQETEEEHAAREAAAETALPGGSSVDDEPEANPDKGHDGTQGMPASHPATNKASWSPDDRRYRLPIDANNRTMSVAEQAFVGFQPAPAEQLRPESPEWNGHAHQIRTRGTKPKSDRWFVGVQGGP